MKSGPEPTWLTIEQISQLVADEYNNIVDFIRQGLIPYRWDEDGVQIWFEGFQICMNELYDLTEGLDDV